MLRAIIIIAILAVVVVRCTSTPDEVPTPSTTSPSVTLDIPSEHDLDIATKQQQCAMEAQLYWEHPDSFCNDPEVGSYTVGPKNCTSLGSTKFCTREYTFVPAQP